MFVILIILFFFIILLFLFCEYLEYIVVIGLLMLCFEKVDIVLLFCEFKLSWIKGLFYLFLLILVLLMWLFEKIVIGFKLIMLLFCILNVLLFILMIW